MNARLGLGIIVPVASVCSHKIYYQNQVPSTNQMTLRTSDDQMQMDRRQTSAFNKYVMNNGMQEICMSYIPPWFYVSPLATIFLSQMVNSKFAKNHHDFERVYLTNEDGKLILDVFESGLASKKVLGKKKEQVIIALPGITGST